MLQEHLATDSTKRKIIMIASVSIPTVPDFVGMLETRIVRELAGLADEWGHCVSALTPWEDDHLLDNPTADLLASHKTTIENLLRLGRFINRSTDQPDYPDRKTSEIVSAALELLADKLRMWHAPRMSKEESDRIITQCFSNES